MRSLFRALTAALVLLLVASPSLAKSKHEDDEPDLTGSYAITKAQIPSVGEFTGTLEIKQGKRLGDKKHGMIMWDLTWKIAGSDRTIHGFGVMINDALIAAYGPGDDYGLSVYYKIPRGGRQEWMIADDTLEGMWFNPKGFMGEEGLRGSLESWDGAYRLHGHTSGSDGPSHPYDGKVEMTTDDVLVHMRWTGTYRKGIDKPFAYDALGLAIPGGLLVAAWGPEKEIAVGTFLFEGKELTGIHAESGGTGMQKLTIPDDVAARRVR
ncbi:MAG: hypothetical protein HY049_15840 [Acidobacteria bacterium]|nr:hypothetical protein [Acidobacteriota bacterium]